MSIPQGFEPLVSKSPFNGMSGPFYYRLSHHGQPIVGMQVLDKHCNTSGRVHGAMIAALADISLGKTIGVALVEAGLIQSEPTSKAEQGAGAPIATVSLNTNYIGTASAGDWVESHVTVRKVGRRMAFADAAIINENATIAQCSAVFAVLKST
ncbi:MAG: PaaI family thioesterase [Pseudomonadota bacterium]